LDRRGSAEWLVCDGIDLFPIGRLGGLARSDSSLRIGEDALAGSWEDVIVPGAHDVHARLDAMDTDGVARAVLFPTIAMRFFAVAERELRRARLRADNGWAADLHKAAPTRLRSVCVVDPDDFDNAVHDVRNAGAQGHSAV